MENYIKESSTKLEVHSTGKQLPKYKFKKRCKMKD